MLDTPALAAGHRSGRTGTRTSPACPCCGGTATEILYRVPSIPVHSCVLLDTPAAASSFPRRDLELAFCEDCGFTFNHIFDDALMQARHGLVDQR